MLDGKNVLLTICCSFIGAAFLLPLPQRRVIPPSSGLQLNFTLPSPFQHFASSDHRFIAEAPARALQKERVQRWQCQSATLLA